MSDLIPPHWLSLIQSPTPGMLAVGYTIGILSFSLGAMSLLGEGSGERNVGETSGKKPGSDIHPLKEEGSEEVKEKGWWEKMIRFSLWTGEEVEGIKTTVEEGSKEEKANPSTLPVEGVENEESKDPEKCAGEEDKPPPLPLSSPPLSVEDDSEELSYASTLEERGGTPTNLSVPVVTLTLGLREETAEEITENLDTIGAEAEPVYAEAGEPTAVPVVSVPPVYSTVFKPMVPPPDWTPPPSPKTSPPPSPSPSLGFPRSLQALKPPTRWKKRLTAAKKAFSDRLLHPTATSTMSLYQGQSGFEDLRKFIKQGGDFCKELAAILHERSEAEAQYAKTLSKLSSKLVKATREGVGTVNSAWQRLGLEMESQSEAHRCFASSLSDEVVKPLRQLVDSQHRIRKSVETAVDKSGKSLSDWRGVEGKAKKVSHSSARECEKLRESALIQSGLIEPGRGSGVASRLSASSLQLHRPSPDKESAKLESKRRKAEESLKKADVEYYSVCLRAERARLEWESAVVRGGHCFQVLEEERLKGLKELATSYLEGFNQIGPKLIEISTRLNDPVTSCDLNQDKDTAASLNCQPVQEQNLPDFYAEHLNLAMTTESRKQALVKLLQLVRQDVERERRGKNGVENLARALKQTPNFATEDTQTNVSEKLHHMRSMLAFLEATRYKLASALAEVEGRKRESHPLAEHITVTRTRQGIQQSSLKVPHWVHKELPDVTDSTSILGDWVERGTADGNSVQPDSDFDEFSSQGSYDKEDFEATAGVVKVSSGGVVGNTIEKIGTTFTGVVSNGGGPPQKCKALYNYTANLYDELSLNPGDIINIHDKQPDGWWLGELNGVVGIFPATYVEEIK